MRTIIHVAYEVTDLLTDDLSVGPLTPEKIQAIKEFFGDTPEIIVDGNWEEVVHVERRAE